MVGRLSWEGICWGQRKQEHRRASSPGDDKGRGWKVAGVGSLGAGLLRELTGVIH